MKKSVKIIVICLIIVAIFIAIDIINNKVEQSVKTGDNTMIGSYAIIMLLAVGAYTATKKVIR